ncbi:uncharacterized protein LOC118143133 [Callithrix jacchus]|uniref:serine/arginine repetitive matrix protein 3-like n=1 Tax=Callithrix jacchus TaxID=9483 RepID=UPI0023DD5910|nr:serine/arginine repetitive matrix protein 3-like [Callithrix jacchus]
MVPLPPPPPLSGLPLPRRASAPSPLGVAVGGEGLSLRPSGCLRRKSRGLGRSSLGGVGQGGRGGRSASAEGPGGSKPPRPWELGSSSRRRALVFAAAPAPCAPGSRRLQSAQPLDVKARADASRSQGSGGGPHASSPQGGARATRAEAQWERDPETSGPSRPCVARRGPPEPAGLPARGETHSSDREELTCRPQPRAWERLFGVLERCLRSRLGLSLPPQKSAHFPGSLWLQPRKSRRPQALRVLVTGSLVVPGLFLHLLHDPVVSLRQPRTIGRKRCRAKGDACWSFPLVTECFLRRICCY